eukprot:5404262-Prymnesium_polylepis.1
MPSALDCRCSINETVGPGNYRYQRALKEACTLDVEVALVACVAREEPSDAWIGDGEQVQCVLHNRRRARLIRRFVYRARHDPVARRRHIVVRAMGARPRVLDCSTGTTRPSGSGWRRGGAGLICFVGARRRLVDDCKRMTSTKTSRGERCRVSTAASHTLRTQQHEEPVPTKGGQRP